MDQTLISYRDVEEGGMGTILCGEADHKCKTGYGKRSVSGHLYETRKSQDKILKKAIRKANIVRLLGWHVLVTAADFDRNGHMTWHLVDYCIWFLNPYKYQYQALFFEFSILSHRGHDYMSRNFFIENKINVTNLETIFII